MRISPITHTKYSFKGMHDDTIERSCDSRLGYLNHTTNFFRYDTPYNDEEFLISYLHTLNNKKPLNIVSIGCSFGEEAYSYAMGLDDLKNKPNISAFDLSSMVINIAKSGAYLLSDEDAQYFGLNKDYYIAKCPVSPFRQEMRDSFQRNFDCISEKSFLYRKKENCLNNINFFNADIKELSSFYKENSQDLILCRNVLYHLEDHEIENVIKQAYEILKPNGLFCLCYRECKKYDDYDEILKEQGFKPLSKEKPYFYIKPKKNLFEKIKDNFSNAFKK